MTRLLAPPRRPNTPRCLFGARPRGRPRRRPVAERAAEKRDARPLDEVAFLLGVPIDQVRTAIDMGLLRCKRLSARCRVVPQAEIDRFNSDLPPLRRPRA